MADKKNLTVKNLLSILHKRRLVSGAVDQRAARENGMVPLRQVAIRKMLQGVTTCKEVVAVTG